MKHVLIDYENIQPKSFDNIETSECHVWLFLGLNQQKSLPLELVETLFKFDTKNVHIIRMQHAGKNALDFYLSFYLGKISEIDPQANVCILAKDSGYDVLVKHLNNAYDDMNIVRLPKVSQAKTIDVMDNDNKKALTIYQRSLHLIKNTPEKSRPSKHSSLKNHLKSYLKDEDSKVVDNLIRQMVTNNVVVIANNNKLVYNI